VEVEMQALDQQVVQEQLILVVEVVDKVDKMEQVAQVVQV
jgi:hypothetical protein